MTATTWKPTHYSVQDGSTVRLVSDTPFTIENECGDRWEDDPSDWAPITATTCTVREAAKVAIGDIIFDACMDYDPYIDGSAFIDAAIEKVLDAIFGSSQAGA
jgi:hypothetical protein